MPLGKIMLTAEFLIGVLHLPTDTKLRTVRDWDADDDAYVEIIVDHPDIPECGRVLGATLVTPTFERVEPVRFTGWNPAK